MPGTPRSPRPPYKTAPHKASEWGPLNLIKVRADLENVSHISTLPGRCHISLLRQGLIFFIDMSQGRTYAVCGAPSQTLIYVDTVPRYRGRETNEVPTKVAHGFLLFRREIFYVVHNLLLQSRPARFFIF